MTAQTVQTTSNVKPIPDGYHTVTPYLTVAGASELIDFLTAAFDAKETYHHIHPV